MTALGNHAMKRMRCRRNTKRSRELVSWGRANALRTRYGFAEPKGLLSNKRG